MFFHSKKIMKNAISFIIICSVIFVSFTNCKKDSTVTNVDKLLGNNMKIKIGTKTFDATLLCK
jgi:hypothetical protein